MRLSMRQNFLWTLAGNVVYAGCQWGILVVLAKIEPAAGKFTGQFALGLAISAPVMMLANLQLRAIQATDARRDYEFGHYFGLRLVTTTAAFLVIAAVAFLGGYESETMLVVLAVGVAKSFESVSDIFYGLFQQQERMDRIALSMMARGLLSLAALALAVYTTGKVLWGVLALGGAWLLVLVVYNIPSGARLLSGNGREEGLRLRPRWEAGRLWRLAWLALPLGFVMMLISLKVNIPRYFIEHHLGKEQLGIFAAMAYPVLAYGLIAAALGQAAVPRLAGYYADGEAAAFKGLLYRLVGFGIVVGSCGVLFALVLGKWVLGFLYGPEYAAHSNVFVWLMAGGGIGFAGSFLGYGITATRQFHRFVLPYLAVVAVTLVASYALVPRYGLGGGAWVVCIASLAACVAPLMILATLRRA